MILHLGNIPKLDMLIDHIYMCIYIYTYMCICLYVYIHTYYLECIHIIHICIYVYILYIYISLIYVYILYIYIIYYVYTYIDAHLYITSLFWIVETHVEDCIILMIVGEISTKHMNIQRFSGNTPS